eukprot:3124105-Prymnesium_polylepis.1
MPKSGPVEGGTRMTVLGSDLTAGSHRLCMIGSTIVPAGVLGDALNCSSNVSISSEMLPAEVPFRVSLNGQQFTSPVAFDVYASGSLNSGLISPTSGPNAGGTLVTTSSPSLGGGSRYNCSFGSAGIVPGTFSSENGTIVCVAPVLNASSGLQPFSVTLNGQ